MQDCFSTFGLDGTGGGGEDGSCSSGDGSGGIMKICDTGGNSGIIGFGAGGTGSDVWMCQLGCLRYRCPAEATVAAVDVPAGVPAL